MNYTEPTDSVNPYKLLLEAVSMIPKSHYMLAFSIFCTIYLYIYLEFHFLQDLRTCFRGSPVSLTYHSNSHIYHHVGSKCRLLHGRYYNYQHYSIDYLKMFIQYICDYLKMFIQYICVFYLIYI